MGRAANAVHLPRRAYFSASVFDTAQTVPIRYLSLYFVTNAEKMCVEMEYPNGISQRVVIVGAGFDGLETVHRLAWRP